MSAIEQKCKNLLLQEGIDINSSIGFVVNGETHTLTFGYILETFMMASDESQIVFLTALEKSLNAKDMGVDKFFEGMGQLLLMTHLSNKIEI
ncbi:hypothetical protein [Sulfurimonas sp.]|uniref:hypothetical protein n=1 Tax=Sulfurimonas sp. TaxID=2022749 RepID=UPI0025E59F86|nr:hypothetical protein [Sulfurimonas sp.]MDD5157988.1 hypothetical protein [Sulfurimonas sp.]